MNDLADTGGTTIIAPVDFHGGSRPPMQSRSAGRWIMSIGFMLMIVVLAILGYYVLTARQVQLSFDPEPDHMELEGPMLQFRLQDHHLLRHGTYTVRAVREGYVPLQETFTVEGGQDNKFHFTFAELPGILALRCVGSEDQEIQLDDVTVAVDGEVAGQTPIEAMSLSRGRHSLRLDHPRYQKLDTQVEVEGLGREQAITLELRPDWAGVDIASAPEGAHVWIDGVEVDRTPCTLDLLSGVHVLAVKAPRFKTWETELDIVAEQPVDLTDITLQPADGRVAVATTPVGAQVMIDGSYAGVSPIEVPMPPDRDVLVQVSRDGYEPAESSVRAESEEVVHVEFEMVPVYGEVRLDVQPQDVTLHVDGAPWGPVPEQITLSAVEHRLEFSKNGYVPATYTVHPRPEMAERITVRLARPGVQPVHPKAKPVAGNGYPLVRLEPGTFTMGASRREQGRRSNETMRNVHLQRPVLMGAREVTNQEFREFTAGHQSGTVESISLSGRDRPVAQVTWDDAARFCNWLSEKDGLPPAYEELGGRMYAVEPMTIGYRLPTEAEWEYAARFDGSGQLLKFPWGASYPPRKKTGNYADRSAQSIINFRIVDYEDGHAGPAPTGSFDPNHFGLFDMGGNVAEWCHDYYTIYTYDDEEISVDPMGPEEGQHHVVRGSSWRHASMSILRLSYRDYSDDKRDDLGFRICRYVTDVEVSE